MISVMDDARYHGYGGYGGGTATKDKTPPPPVTGLAAASGNGNVILLWTNPIDTDFVGLRLLRKEGSYPTSPTDGVLVYSGANNSYTDNTVTNGTQYYYHAFTFDYDNNFNTTESGQEATATPQAYVIYGVKIDTTNSNPSTAVTYIENSVGFAPASGNNGAFNGGSWLDKFPYNLIKPCLLKADGTVNYYLNPNDYTKKLDGTTSGLTGADGSVMIELAKMYWKIETLGNFIYIRFSGTKIDSSYKCLAHLRGVTEKDKCYIGAFLGYSVSSKLWSLSGVAPTLSQTIAQFRTLAQAQVTGHDQIGYFQLLMLQILFVVMFKSLDSQTALGRGYVDANASAIATGGTNAKGMYYGETTGKQQMKCFGIEDLWGNLECFIDGLYLNSTRNVLIGNQNFNDAATGYTDYGQASASTLSGYINSVMGGTETGFIPKGVSGSVTTYFSDYGYYQPSCVATCSGTYTSAGVAGIFGLNARYSVTAYNTSMASRLMYL